MKAYGYRPAESLRHLSATSAALPDGARLLRGPGQLATASMCQAAVAVREGGVVSSSVRPGAENSAEQHERGACLYSKAKLETGTRTRPFSTDFLRGQSGQQWWRS